MGSNFSVSTTVETIFSATLDSLTEEEGIQPSITNACSLTATRTGALRISKSRSINSMHANKSAPLDEFQDSISPSSVSSFEIKSLFSFSNLFTKSIADPEELGIVMASKSNSEIIACISSLISLSQKTAAIPLLLPLSLKQRTFVFFSNSFFNP